MAASHCARERGPTARREQRWQHVGVEWRPRDPGRGCARTAVARWLVVAVFPRPLRRAAEGIRDRAPVARAGIRHDLAVKVTWQRVEGLGGRSAWCGADNGRGSRRVNSKSAAMASTAPAAGAHPPPDVYMVVPSALLARQTRRYRMLGQVLGRCHDAVKRLEVALAAAEGGASAGAADKPPRGPASATESKHGAEGGAESSGGGGGAAAGGERPGVAGDEHVDGESLFVVGDDGAPRAVTLENAGDEVSRPRPVATDRGLGESLKVLEEQGGALLKAAADGDTHARDAAAGSNVVARLHRVSATFEALCQRARTDRARLRELAHGYQTEERARDRAEADLEHATRALKERDKQVEQLSATEKQLREQLEAWTRDSVDRATHDSALSQLEWHRESLAERDTQLGNARRDAENKAEEVAALAGTVKKQEIEIELHQARLKSMQGVFDALLSAKDREKDDEMSAIMAQVNLSSTTQKDMEAQLAQHRARLASMSAQLHKVREIVAIMRDPTPPDAATWARMRSISDTLNAVLSGDLSPGAASVADSVSLMRTPAPTGTMATSATPPAATPVESPSLSMFSAHATPVRTPGSSRSLHLRKQVFDYASSVLDELDSSGTATKAGMSAIAGAPGITPINGKAEARRDGAPSASRARGAASGASGEHRDRDGGDRHGGLSNAGKNVVGGSSRTARGRVPHFSKVRLDESGSMRAESGNRGGGHSASTSKKARRRK